MPDDTAALRARRLLTLVPFLREQRAIPIAELAEAVGSDEAQLAADLTVLSVCGGDERDPAQLVGVIVEDGVAQVVADLPALERPVRLTQAEARALVTALQAIGTAPDSDLAAKLTEFAGRAVDPEELASTVRAAFAPSGQAALLAALSVHAENHVAARIAYISATSGAETSRVVHPYALYRWRDVWYLVAFCETTGEERTFRVDRITGVATTGVHFDLPAGFVATASPLPDLDALPRATVRFSSDAPDLNERDWPGAVFVRADDGSVTAEVPYAGESWISRAVIARLGEAEVLEPAHLRVAVADSARKMLEEAAG
ncbi:MAG TPA: WYL domain-containing protein [Coriobacteriia bacterium]